MTPWIALARLPLGKDGSLSYRGEELDRLTNEG